MKIGAGVDLLFVSPLGEHMRYAVHLHFPASNNMAEYEALLCGLKIAIEIGVKRLNVRGDSQLVIDQVMKNASSHDDKMEAYRKAVRALEDKFYGSAPPVQRGGGRARQDRVGADHRPPECLRSGRRPTVRHPRAAPLEQHSTLGGSLESSGRRAHGRGPSNEAYVLSILEGYGASEAKAIDVEPAPSEVDWCDKYDAWMDRGELPSDRSEARRIARMAKSFTLVDGELYKRAASGILQRCVPIP
jgi:hypothetical protein